MTLLSFKRRKLRASFQENLETFVIIEVNFEFSLNNLNSLRAKRSSTLSGRLITVEDAIYLSDLVSFPD